jgi:hypothetical protein
MAKPAINIVGEAAVSRYGNIPVVLGFSDCRLAIPFLCKYWTVLRRSLFPLTKGLGWTM